MKRVKRITGGRKGFQKAIKDAYASEAKYPTIRYSHTRGFHVEDLLTPSDGDVVWYEEPFIWADTGKRSLRAVDYPDVRNKILGIKPRR